MDHSVGTPEGDHDDQVVFLDDAPADYTLPTFITTTTARELFGLLPGETVAQAAARKAQETGKDCGRNGK